MAHAIMAAAMPRLLAASAATAVLASLLVRLAFRRRQGFLEVRRTTRSGQHRGSRTGRDDS